MVLFLPGQGSARHDTILVDAIRIDECAFGHVYRLRRAARTADETRCAGLAVATHSRDRSFGVYRVGIEDIPCGDVERRERAGGLADIAMRHIRFVRIRTGYDTLAVDGGAVDYIGGVRRKE